MMMVMPMRPWLHAAVKNTGPSTLCQASTIVAGLTNRRPRVAPEGALDSALRRAEWPWHALSFAICFLLAVIFTLPTSLAPASGLMGYSGDNFQHAWFLWEFAHAVAKLHNPFYTDLIYFPSRANLAWSTMDPLAGAVALPVSLALGPVVAYNVSLVLQLALAAFFARLLCLRVCENQIAALVGGACFGFSPFLLAHSLGHLSLVTAFPAPLYFLALDRLLTSNKPGWKDGTLLGGALLLTALAHYNYTVICILATLVVIAVDIALGGWQLLWRSWKALACGAVTFVVVFSPMLAMLVGNAADRPKPRGIEHVQQYSADVLGFLIPSWNHILLGRFARRMDLSVFVAGYEGTVYIGIVILALAVFGAIKARELGRTRWMWQALTLGVAFYLLSLGPSLRVLGHATSIPGPAALLYRLPGLDFVSAPARFAVITALAAAILVSLGITFLLERLPHTPQRYLRSQASPRYF